VAKRTFGPIGPLGLPARAVHDGIAQAVYGGLRGGGSIAGDATGQIVSMVGREDRQTGSTRSTNLALSALNAAIGDGLADHGDPLAIRMAVRDAGRDIALSPAALARRSLVPRRGGGVRPRTGRDRALLVAGPGRRRSRELRRRLAGRARLHPVYLRYNSGRHISDNGRELSGVLRHLTAAWPAPVDELLLVGHSMGGLTTRSAATMAGPRPRRGSAQFATSSIWAHPSWRPPSSGC